MVTLWKIFIQKDDLDLQINVSSQNYDEKKKICKFGRLSMTTGWVIKRQIISIRFQEYTLKYVKHINAIDDW